MPAFRPIAIRSLAFLCVVTCSASVLGTEEDSQQAPQQAPQQATVPATAKPERTGDELPANPDLVSPVPAPPDAVTSSDVHQALQTQPPTRIRMGLQAGAGSRPSADESAEYAPGFAWGGYASVVMLPWLSLRLGSVVAGYSVSPNDGAWGLQGVAADPPPMRELSLRGELELRRAVAPRLSVWGVVGFGWARVSMATFTLNEPYPASVEMRSGSVLEMPLGAGVGYQFWDDTLALTLDFRVIPAVSQTGDFFEPQPGHGETVRSDTGARVTLAGLPELRAASLVQLGLELSF